VFSLSVCAPQVRIGFFLHSPFPSSEIFRAFPMRAELLRGLLNADLVRALRKPLLS
jgi:trehalose 6-phosphate synthase/phosphatase